MTGEKAFNPLEYLRSHLENVEKPKLNISLILEWRKILISLFGEENIQITTSFDIYLDEQETYLKKLNKAQCDNLIDQLSRSLSYIIYIRFKDIVITNSKKQSTTIEELFVSVNIAKNEKVLSLNGIVTQFTTERFLSGYKHSHLPRLHPDSNYIPQWEHFCLGSGTPLSLLLAKQERMTSQNFKLLVLNIRNYVKWESIEGGPYMRMDIIKQAAYNNLSHISRNNHGFLRVYHKRDVENLNYGRNAINVPSRVALSLLNLYKKSPVDLLKRLKIKVTDEEVIVEDNENLDYLIIEALNELKSNPSTCNVIYYNKDDSINLFASSFFDSIGAHTNLVNAIKKTNTTIENSGKSEFKFSKDQLTKEIFKFKGNPVYLKISDLEQGGKGNEKQKEGEEQKEKEFKSKFEEIKYHAGKKWKIVPSYKKEFLNELSEILSKELSKTLEKYESDQLSNSQVSA